MNYMRAEQERLYELLDDIDEVCRSQKARYHLVGKELLWNMTGRNPFRCSADICMTLQDYRKILHELSAIPCRTIEDISSNSDMPGVFYRFVDTESLMIDTSFHKVLREFGIAVNIHIIRRVGSISDRLDDLERVMDSEIEGVDRKITQEVKKDFKKARQSSDYHEKLCKMLEESALSPDDKGARSLLRFPGEEQMEFPSGFWEKAGTLSVFGKKYMTVSDKTTYINIHYGDPEKAIYCPDDFPGKVISDAYMPYREAAADILKALDDRCYWEDRQRFYSLFFDDYDKKVSERNRLNDYMLASASRIVLWKKYYPCKKKIIGSYNGRRFDELMLILDKMDSEIKKYEGKGYLCVFDKEIWDIYLAMLKQQGETERAGYLEKLYYSNPFKELDNIDELLHFTG